MQNVLIIEDDEIQARMYADKLKAEGFEVSVAKSGQDGLTQISNTSFNLIVLDIMLGGGMNGFDVLESIKRNQNTKDIPVLVLSNLDKQEKIAKDIGADAYMLKAKYTPTEVMLEIKRLLTKS